MTREELSPLAEGALAQFLASGGRIDDPKQRDAWQTLADSAKTGPCPFPGRCEGTPCPYGPSRIVCARRDFPEIALLALDTIDALGSTPVSASSLGEKPVTAFEEGKWYRWTGAKNRPTHLPEG